MHYCDENQFMLSNRYFCNTNPFIHHMQVQHVVVILSHHLLSLIDLKECSHWTGVWRFLYESIYVLLQ